MPQNLNASQPDLYTDAAEATPAPPPEEAATEEAPDETEQTGGSTALLPINFFGSDVKPGDTCEVRVVKVHDDQVEVEYGEKESPEMESEPEAAAPSEGDMAAMMG